MKIVSTKLIERIEIEAPASEQKKVLDYVYSNGYRTLYTGPKITDWPKTDNRIYRVIAEREIEDD